MWHTGLGRPRQEADTYPAGIAEFWEAALREDRYKGHPALQPSGATDCTVPLSFHVDGAEVYADTEFYFWSWGSMLAHGSCFDTRFPIAAVPYVAIRTAAVKQAVSDEIARFIAWSLDILERGPQICRLCSMVLLCKASRTCHSHFATRMTM